MDKESTHDFSRSPYIMQYYSKIEHIPHVAIKWDKNAKELYSVSTNVWSDE